MVYIQHIQRQYDLEMETFSVNDPIIFLDGRFWDPVELIVYPSGQFQNLFSLSITRSQITRKLSWAGHKWTKWSAVYFIWRALGLRALWMYYNWPGKYSGKKQREHYRDLRLKWTSRWHHLNGEICYGRRLSVEISLNNIYSYWHVCNLHSWYQYKN